MDKRIWLASALCVGVIGLIAGGMSLINPSTIHPYVILGLAILVLFFVLILLTRVGSNKG